MTQILNLFGSVKNIFIALFSILGGLYIAKQKYDAYKAKEDLKDIKQDLDKANVVVTKEKADAKANAKEIETNTKISVLKDIASQEKDAAKEIETIKTTISKAKKKKEAFYKGEPVTIEV